MNYKLANKMSHNHMSNNQQQHHQIVMSSSSGVNPTGQPPMQQRPMIAQRGVPAVAPAKAGYQMPATSMNQFTHMQPQQQPPQQQQQTTSLMGGYHKQKQMSPDLSQFASTMGVSMPAQNGTYQSAPTSNLHSTMGYEGGQLNLHHHQYQPVQQQQQQQQNLPTPLQQHQYPTQHQQQQPQPLLPTQPTQQTNAMSYRQSTYSHAQQQTHHHLMQQQQQQQHQHQQQKQQQVQHHQQQQQPQIIQQQQQQQPPRPSYQQQLQIQQHLHQRSLNQQQRYNQKQQASSQQPKQILQNTTGGKVNSDGISDAAQVDTAVGNAAHMNNSSTPQPVQNEDAVNEPPDGADDDNVKTEPNPEEPHSNKSSDTSSNASEKPSMANTKEKTPMCLINELARFNKMTHQYTLVDEQGPAHKKTFYVKLKLGDEEYSSSGESIKKAQHAAAAIALTETKYQHPPPKTVRSLGINLADGNITPTVELNALAMKRGEATSYKSIEPQQPHYYHQPHMDFRGMYNQRYHHQYMRGGPDPRYRGGGGMMWPMRYNYPRPNRAYYVSLRVGHREFIGDGPTRQAARHNAAQKALRILKNLPLPNEETNAKADEVGEEEGETDDSLKSEISLVHEIALRRNMNVLFEVIRETGPPHMKNFVSRCTVADFVTEGEGNSKKLSKKKAAELMLEELKKLTPSLTPVTARPKLKPSMNKKKNRNIIKSELQQQKADPNYGVGINPISRLIQIMQAQKKKEPVYTLIAERGLPRRREFIVQVEVEEKTCTGSGPNKKLAKRGAAETMLQLLGYTKPSPQPTKSSFKNSSSESGQANGDRKVVTFVDGDSRSGDTEQSSTSPTQRVPGLLHLPTKPSQVVSGNVSSKESTATPKESAVNLESILKPNLRPEIQLRELCKAMGYHLEIDDFTKKHPSGTEHITRITIGSENQQSFHGSNNSLESSRDMAALDALKVMLAKVKNINSAGDCHQVKKDMLIRANPSASKKEVAK